MEHKLAFATLCRNLKVTSARMALFSFFPDVGALLSNIYAFR